MLGGKLILKKRICAKKHKSFRGEANMKKAVKICLNLKSGEHQKDSKKIKMHCKNLEKTHKKVYKMGFTTEKRSG